MIVRIASALSLFLGLTLFLLYLHLMGKGLWADPASRHLRAMKDRTAVPNTLEPFSIAEIAKLPVGLPLDQYALIEARAVQVEGHVQVMVRAADGDYHLELVPEALGADFEAVAYVTAEITPQWHRNSESWSFERLLATLRPPQGGPAPWAEPPPRVRIGGWLLYDYPYEGVMPRPGLPPRLSNWEIHPVTRLEVWDDLRAAFVEHPR